MRTMRLVKEDYIQQLVHSVASETCHCCSELMHTRYQQKEEEYLQCLESTYACRNMQQLCSILVLLVYINILSRQCCL